MSRSIDLPLANYPNGTRSTTWRSLTPDITRASVEVQRCTSADPTIWPNVTTSLDLTIDFSLDGGTTIALSATSGHVVGGIQPGLHGTEADVTRITLIDIPAGANRAIRLTGTIAGGPLRTQGTIELT